MNNINLEYFYWLCDRIIQDEDGFDQIFLLEYLHKTDYIWVVEMDENRAGDGVWLRREFKTEVGYSGELLSGRPCSVLEMLVALCIRVEDNVMYDWDEGDRTGVWFWLIMKNLGLEDMDNHHFEEKKVARILDIFMHRTYKNGGLGCPFKMKNLNKNEFEKFRNEELWNQALDYLSEVFEV